MNENLDAQRVYPTSPADPGMVWMANPTNTAWKQVPLSAVPEGRRSGYRVVTPRVVAPLNAGQQVAKGVGSMLPPLLGVAGGAAGTIAAGGPTMGVGAIPGAAVGAAAGGAMGQMGNEALQRMAGIPQEPGGPLGALGRTVEHGAMQGTYTLMGAPLEAMAAKATGGIAQPLMRWALNPKAVGPKRQFLEDIALKFKVPVTQETMPFLDRLTNVYRKGVERAVAAETANPSGVRFSWNVLRGAIAKARADAKASDAISMASEQALEKAQQILKHKYEGKGIFTPAEMQGVKRFAQEQVKKLYEARKAMKDPEVGPMESAYGIIAAEAQKMLEQIPRVAKMNQKASEAISIQKAIWQATRRKPPTLVPGMIGAGAVGMHHAPITDPMSVLLGAAGFFGTQAAMSPQAMSRLALATNNPAVQRGVGAVAGQVPRALGSGVNLATGQTPLRSLLDILLQGQQPPDTTGGQP